MHTSMQFHKTHKHKAKMYTNTNMLLILLKIGNEKNFEWL